MYTHNRPRFAAGILVTLALLSAACSDPASRINAPSLSSSASHGSGSSNGGSGAASNFAVLANEAVTCTGGSIIGDVGTFLSTGSITASCIAITTGTVHAPGDAASVAAYNSFLSTYAALAPRSGDCDVGNTLPATIAANTTLFPGVYCAGAGLTATDVTLTLDGQGDPNAVWIFKIGTGGTGGTGALTGTRFSVVMAGSGQACNVTWWVSQAATMTTSNLKGSILAGAAITLETGGTLIGNAWAGASGVGDVTITGTAVTGCEGGVAGGPGSCKERSDRVTGGGWIIGKSGEKSNFAVSGGIDIKKNAFWGQLEYQDKGLSGRSDDVMVKGTGVTAYRVGGNAVTRIIEGTAKVDGERGWTYQVVVSDNGPGRTDVFTISLWHNLLRTGTPFYTASGTLGGGNIQLHTNRGNGRGCDRDGDNGDNDDDDDDDDDDHDDDDDDDDDDHGN